MYTSVGWLVIAPSYFSQYVVFSGVLPALFAADDYVMWCAREK